MYAIQTLSILIVRTDSHCDGQRFVQIRRTNRILRLKRSLVYTVTAFSQRRKNDPATDAVKAMDGLLDILVDCDCECGRIDGGSSDCDEYGECNRCDVDHYLENAMPKMEFHDEVEPVVFSDRLASETQLEEAIQKSLNINLLRQFEVVRS